MLKFFNVLLDKLCGGLSFRYVTFFPTL